MFAGSFFCLKFKGEYGRNLSNCFQMLLHFEEIGDKISNTKNCPKKLSTEPQSFILSRYLPFTPRKSHSKSILQTSKLRVKLCRYKKAPWRKVLLERSSSCYFFIGTIFVNLTFTSPNKPDGHSSESLFHATL